MKTREIENNLVHLSSRLRTDIYYTKLIFEIAYLKGLIKGLTELSLSILICSSCSARDNTTIVNGNPINCSHEAYNCPSYTGKYQSKRLKNCDEVRIVWDTCKDDVHDLDRDNDGKPCEKDCRF